MDTAPRRHLEAIRDTTLDLHRVLMHEARIDHELLSGPIPSAGAFLQMLAYDPHFAWLRTLSGLVASMDETLDIDALSAAQVEVVRDEVRRALTEPSFAAHYLPRLQASADVVIAHGALQRALDRSGLSGHYGKTQVERVVEAES